MVRAVLAIFFLTSFLLSKEIETHSPNEIRFMIAAGENHGRVFNKISELCEIESVNSFLKDRSILNQRIINSSEQDLKLYLAAEKLNRTFRLKFKNDFPPQHLVKRIKKEISEIEIVELVSYPRLQSKEDYNDPLIDETPRLEQISAYEAWEIEDGDTSITIGISDAGFLPGHEDLVGQLAKFWGEIPGNGIDDDGNGYIDDFNQFNLVPNENGTNWGNTASSSDHGTRCAGIIGAEPNNGKGIIGVANKCRIFPIKIAPFGTEILTHAYESIIFAADRGLDILSCSWGSQGLYSGIEQAVIDYAVAKGVTIIVSAGNTDFSTLDEQRIQAFYPSAYKGVLAVGSVSENDIVAGSSSLGVHTRILAKGVNNLTAVNQSSAYNDRESGTSFASPIVAGAAALVKARFKELDLQPQQIIEHLRQSTDIVSNINASIKEITPGRLNLFKALTTQPLGKPGFAIDDVLYFDEKENPKSRFREGEEVRPDIYLNNFLDGEGPLEFKLSTALDLSGNSIEFIDSVKSIVLQANTDKLLLNDFKFRMLDDVNRPILFRVDISGNNYSDFFLFEFLPNPPIATFENDSLIFSMADNGRFGFFDDEQYYGKGFMNKSDGNWFWEGGLFALSENTFSESLSLSSRFIPLESFSGYNNDMNVLTGVGNNNPVKFNIRQEVKTLENEATAQIDVYLENETGQTINNVAYAYELDWDLGPGFDDYKYNKSEIVTEEYFGELVGKNATIMISYDSSQTYFVAMGIYNFQGSDVVAASGPSFDFKDLDLSSARDIINSGTSIQGEDLIDIGNVIGTKFDDPLTPNSSFHSRICLAAGRSREELIMNIGDCISYINSIEKEKTEELFYSNGIIYLPENLSIESYLIFDLQGAEIYSENNLDSNIIQLELPVGIYFILVETTKGRELFKILVN